LLINRIDTREFVVEMFIGSHRFIVLCGTTVFADPGMQGIDVNTEIFGYLRIGLSDSFASLTAKALNSAV
jgi:hypothetical protein